jgi:hypothetical protein
MALLAPPPAPPVIGVDDNDRLRRFRMRSFQVMAATVTVLATVWFCTLGVGAFWIILALMVAKHILVAILMMGLGVDAPRQPAP